MSSPETRVFVSAVEVIAPGIPDSETLLRHLNAGFHSYQAPLRETVLQDTRLEDIVLQLDTEHRHYPNPRDLKSMRQDVAAMCVCLGQLLEKSNLAHFDFASVPLFMSTGPSQSGLSTEIENVYATYSALLERSLSERNQRLFDEIHPLFALKALTNSAQAFAAQFYGFRNQNTTFGNTSHQTFYALKEAVSRLQSGECSMAVIGASNGAGFFSLLMNSTLIPSSSLRESPAAVAMILESQEGVLQRGHRPLCELQILPEPQKLPSLHAQPHDQLPYQSWASQAADFIIFSGGLSEERHAREQRAVGAMRAPSFSFYPYLGSTGNAAPLFNTAAAATLIAGGGHPSALCLNEDLYARECAILLGNIK